MNPIPKAKRPERPETVSMTLLSFAERCRYSALLYMRHRDAASSHEMQRGSAYHEAQARMIETLVTNDETSMPGDVAKDIAQHVMDTHPEWNLPAKQQDAVRLMAWNWAEATVIDPATIESELLMRIEIDGWVVRGKLDRLDIQGGEAWIRDSKTSLHLPDQEEYEAKLQLPTYALLVAEGVLDSTGLPIGGGVDIFHLFEDYPRYRKDDGTLWTRYAMVTRPELADLKASLRGILAKLGESLETGEWPATSGTHCSICPARPECPIPDEEHELEAISSWADAEAACEQLYQLEARRDRLRKSVKGWAQDNGDVEFGTDLVFGGKIQVSRSVDRAGLLRAAESTANYGEPFDPDAFVKERPSNRFEIRQRETV